MDGHGAINDTARALFAPLGGDYDRWAAILSFGQDPHWRRFLIKHAPVDAGRALLDVATGTGAIARGMVRRYGCRVVGVDQSPQMLDGARARIAKAGLADRIELHLGSAETLEFEPESFDALTTGYLLRYLDDPLRTMTDLLRLLRPGAPFALLDFAVPPNAVARALWHAYTGVGLPTLGRAGLAGLGGGRPLPPPEHHGLRRRVPAGRPARAARRGGRSRRERAPAEPRRRPRRVGGARCPVTPSASRSTRCGPAACAIASRCCTSRTPPGTSPTSRSARRSPSAWTAPGWPGRWSPSCSPSASRRTASTS